MEVGNDDHLDNDSYADAEVLEAVALNVGAGLAIAWNLLIVRHFCHEVCGEDSMKHRQA